MMSVRITIDRVAHLRDSRFDEKRPCASTLCSLPGGWSAVTFQQAFRPTSFHGVKAGGQFRHVCSRCGEVQPTA